MLAEQQQKRSFLTSSLRASEYEESLSKHLADSDDEVSSSEDYYDDDDDDTSYGDQIEQDFQLNGSGGPS